MSAQKILKSLGGIIRQTGQALDTLGLSIQGKYGYKEGGEIMTSIFTYSYVLAVTSNANLLYGHNFFLNDRSGYVVH